MSTPPPTGDERPVLVAVPTYNESEGISQLITRLLAGTGAEVDVLVVDDASPDGTAGVVRRHAEDSPRIHLLERPAKLGLGSAYLTAFRWALERGYWAVVEMDADLSHDPLAVPTLLTALDGADLVIGSRYVPGGRIENWGTLRRLLSRGGNLYAALFLGFGITDSTSGFRAYKVDGLREQDLGSIRAEGYAFQIEMTRRIHLSGGRIVEVPITFVERTSGRSKLSRRIVLEAVWRVAAWGIEDRFRKRRPQGVVSRR